MGLVNTKLLLTSGEGVSKQENFEFLRKSYVPQVETSKWEVHYVPEHCYVAAAAVVPEEADAVVVVVVGVVAVVDGNVEIVEAVWVEVVVAVGGVDAVVVAEDAVAVVVVVDEEFGTVVEEVVV